MTRTENDLAPRRIFRGGCWNDFDPSWVRAASRYAYDPARRCFNVGFRCALRGREPR